MKKEKKTGKIKAWWNDLKRQVENVEKCLKENKKANVCYSAMIALLVILYFIGGVALHRFFV
jgi:hypothetical protein